MIKVIDIKFTDFCWKEKEFSNDSNYSYYESPIIEQFLADGWNIKDFKVSENNCVFILEKKNYKP